MKDQLVPRQRIRRLLSLPVRESSDHAEGAARFRWNGEDLMLIAYDKPAARRYDEQRHELLLDGFPFLNLQASN